MKRIIFIIVPVIAILAGGATRARAQDSAGQDISFLGWGPRIGATVEPDQFHFGAHADFGMRDSHLRFEPNAELGLGDGLTTLSLNLDGAYRFSSQWESWSPYLGGGVGYNFYGTEDKGLTGDTTGGAGLNVLGGFSKGMASGSRFFVEGRAGFIDAPDFMVTTGWTFGH